MLLPQLKTIYSNLKRNARWAYYAYYKIRFIKNGFKKKKGSYAIFNLDHRLLNDDFSRYLYTFSCYFRDAGFKVVIKTDWQSFGDFSKPSEFKKSLFHKGFTFVKNCSTPLNTIVLFQSGRTLQTININYGYHIGTKGNFDCILNYIVHPDQYQAYSHTLSIKEQANRKRNMRIFFAGDINEIKYASIKINKFFDVLPRAEVITNIRSHFNADCLFFESDKDQLSLDRILESDNYCHKIIISTLKIKQELWPAVLSKTDFFICPPGVFIPLCHNCIEAMAVGAIPILEYGDLFSPHLEHGKNCIRYTGQDELKLAIEKTLNMDQDEIDVMRSNVLEYYLKNLSIESSVKRIKAFSTSDKNELNIAVPFVATQQQWDEYVRDCRHLFGRWMKPKTWYDRFRIFYLIRSYFKAYIKAY